MTARKGGFKARDVEVTKTRRYINAAVIPLTTVLAARTILVGDAQTNGLLEVLGVAAAVLTTTVVALWHLASAKRRATLAFVLLGCHLVAGAGALTAAHLRDDLGAKILWISYPTMACVIGALLLATLISVQGLRPAGQQR